ncbi:hypothetical protein TNCV_1083871 [Trichonephila clavipes]|nr:hypothetical protein TNCV_1083871 [Trichonephila clavipes]
MRKYYRPSKVKSQDQLLKGSEIFSDPIGLKWEHDILMFKPTPCLLNGSQVDDLMGLDEWKKWLKSQVRD